MSVGKTIFNSNNKWLSAGIGLFVVGQSTALIYSTFGAIYRYLFISFNIITEKK